MVLFVLQVDGRTALHYAAENDHAEVVKTLLKQGNVNPHTINKVSFFHALFRCIQAKNVFVPFISSPLKLGKTAREAVANPKIKALLPNAPGT